MYTKELYKKLRDDGSQYFIRPVVTDLLDEIERMREALEKIAKYDTDPMKTRVWTWAHDFEIVKKIARAALSDKEVK